MPKLVCALEKTDEASMMSDAVLSTENTESVAPDAMRLKVAKKTINLTRQSSRIQERDALIINKGAAKNANHKGITQLPSISTNASPCPLEDIARVCGFSLGPDEESRLANISLIKAKEDATSALQAAKQKMLAGSSESTLLNVVESSENQDNGGLELLEDVRVLNEETVNILSKEDASSLAVLEVRDHNDALSSSPSIIDQG
jgi:hypothetical protein